MCERESERKGTRERRREKEREREQVRKEERKRVRKDTEGERSVGFEGRDGQRDKGKHISCENEKDTSFKKANNKNMK